MPDVQMSRFIIAKEGVVVVVVVGGREAKEVERRRREGGVGGMGWEKAGRTSRDEIEKRRESETHE